MSSLVFDPSLVARQPTASALLGNAITRNCPANAYLFVGRAGEDKGNMALQIALFLNCSSKSRMEQGSCLVANLNEPEYHKKYCQNCQWIVKGEHPQAWIVLQDQTSNNERISVEKVRLLTSELAKTSCFFRVIVIPDAAESCLHRPAANAILKSLEEPPNQCLFVLIALNVETVLPTIASRCQIVPFHQQLKPGLWLDSYKSDEQLILPEVPAFTSAYPAKLEGTDLEYLRQLQELSTNHIQPQLLIDLLIAREYATWRKHAISNAAVSFYLNKVFALSEATKAELDAFVKANVSLECFIFALNELRHTYLGE